MCTALSLKSKRGAAFFGRNMDFSYELDPEVFIVPRGYSFQNNYSNMVFETKYKFIGTGQDLGKVVFADGINEKGIGVAALYFQGYAEYDTEINDQKPTIGSIEVVGYLLGECSSLDEVVRTINHVNIVGMEDSVTGAVAPLHWFVTDRSGNTVTIEKTTGGLRIFRNEVGVLANSPTFDWHMTNLRNYLNLSPYQSSTVSWGDITITPFGQGAGTIGLPGDYTSPSRFVKTVFQKSFVSPVDDQQTLINCFNVINGVSIPKGVVMTSRDTPDYTQYTVFMNVVSGDYYFKTHDNPQIFRVNINDVNSNQITSIGKLKREVEFKNVV